MIAGIVVPDALVSLYLDIEPGQKADLEVVARAALAFDVAVKELAYILDPGLELRVELESGTEGTLSLNSIIRPIKTIGERSPRFIAGDLWFVIDATGWGVDRILDHLFAAEPAHVATLSSEDKNDIAQIVAKAIADELPNPMCKAFIEPSSWIRQSKALVQPLHPEPGQVRDRRMFVRAEQENSRQSPKRSRRWSPPRRHFA